MKLSSRSMAHFIGEPLGYINLSTFYLKMVQRMDRANNSFIRSHCKSEAFVYTNILKAKPSFN